MSSRARRITAQTTVVSFPWGGSRSAASRGEAPSPAPEAALAQPDAQQLEQIERDAYAKGFEEGERTGAAAASERGAAMLERLTQTLEELATVRTEMIRHTERQMVELALAVARRIVHREVSLDRDLLIAMARVALDRLGESTRVTVRLHPDEYEATDAGRAPQRIGVNVMVLADPRVERGGCRIESDLGEMDAGIDAQIQEIAKALLGEEPREAASNVVTIAGRRRVDPDDREIATEQMPA